MKTTAVSISVNTPVTYFIDYFATINHVVNRAGQQK